MHRLIPNPFFLTLCLTLLGPTPLSANSERDQANWYQVEILIFKNLETSAITEEQWPHRVDSRYPQQVIQLETGDQYGNLKISPALLDLTDSSASDWQLQTVAQPLAFTSDFSNISPSTTTASTEQTDKLQALASSHTTAAFELTIPKPYRILPGELREFNQYAQNMRWSKNYRVLFHQSWRQSFKDRSNNEAIAIESDSHIGDYPELQGTIKLSVSRYLHLETRLWLNMPTLPWIEEEPRSIPGLRPKGYDKSWKFTLPTHISIADYMQAAQTGDNSIKKPDSSVDDQASSNLDKRLQEQLETISRSRYPYAGPVLMEQKRRMRSGEEHYIDHPLFGLLIKITPYEFAAFVETQPDISATGLEESPPVRP